MKTLFFSSAWTVRRRSLCQLGMAALGVLLISGCATQNSGNTGSSTLQTVAPIVARPDGAVRIDTSSQEVARLWAAAEKARAQNRTEIALELLYEAMEIDPDNSLLWSRAAEYKLDSLEPALAENYAARSNSLAGENRRLLYRNWLIIEHARSMRGDLLGERSAHKQVQLYQYQQ
ncbi:MAG: hypothetical protein AB8B87_21350 [Granulosicoccus sp.]